MTNIARFAIEQPLYTWLLILTCLIGGIVGIDKVGRLEDPNFPIKTVLIVTRYDGASAVEVEQEVTDVIEAAIQELPGRIHRGTPAALQENLPSSRVSICTRSARVSIFDMAACTAPFF